MIVGYEYAGGLHFHASLRLGLPALLPVASSRTQGRPGRGYRRKEQPPHKKLADPLTLLLYPAGGSGESALYEDAGNGFGYESDEYAYRSVVCEASEGGLSIVLSQREGSFIPERSTVCLRLEGVSTRPEHVSANGERADWSYGEAGEMLVVRLAEGTGETTVEVSLSDPR